MEALFLSSFSSSIAASIKLSRLHDRRDWCTLVKDKKRVSPTWCRVGGGGGGDGRNIKPERPIRVSSLLKDRGQVLIREQSSPAMEAETLVLSPNGVKTLMPFNGAAMVGIKEGLGIVSYLQGKTFLITGSTVLIEKVLRMAPDVGKIYLLIKAKSKEAAIQRLKNEVSSSSFLFLLSHVMYITISHGVAVFQVLDAELFNTLKETHGASYQSFMLDKLVPVTGNICDSNIGLQAESAEEIANEVDVIINSAANTTFNERYDVALDINTRGPGNLMGFAKKCKNLKLFLQVSTAYVNGQRQGRIMEKPFSMGDCIATENFVEGNRKALDIEKEMKLALDASRKGAKDQEEGQKMKDLGLERARSYGWQDTYVFTKAMGEMMINSTRGDVPVVIIRPSVIESTYKDPFPGWMEGNRMMDPIVLCYGKGQLTGFLVDPKGVLDVVPADMVVNATLAAIAKHGMAKADPEPEINVFDNSNTHRLMENMSEEEKIEFGFDVGSINWNDYITNVHIPGLRRHVLKGRA
ncbi:unnamed protein product [Eruca vesicaria subsp. sativa]|uniref:Fatty acyl-CoA reductase n=1 Tax=Eruca vesicaria subsp. sativa TaxID=29727 RepID=A0ABC8KDH7_ERUVS|nr:unnamed protein product [Eruca vesicaria subsp. sativa]